MVSRGGGPGVSGCQEQVWALGERLPPSPGWGKLRKGNSQMSEVAAEMPLRLYHKRAPQTLQGPGMHLLKAQSQGFAWGEGKLQMSGWPGLLQGHSSSVPVGAGEGRQGDEQQHSANRSLHPSTWVSALSASMQPGVSLLQVDVWYSGRAHSVKEVGLEREKG